MIIESLLVGLLVFCAMCAVHYRAVAHMRAAELERLRADFIACAELLDQARNRLLQAWKDGYTVPAAVDDEPTAASDPLLSPAQLEWLDQWEDPLGRARWESFLLRRMRAGASADASIADAELQVIRGQEHLLTPQPATSAVTLG